MNIAFFLHPKGRVTYLYDDFTVRQGLEKMRHHGYSAVPVITRSGQYVGTVSEGDFLWHLLDLSALRVESRRSLEELSVQDILRENSYPSVPITVTMEELVDAAMNQNFIPVVDDMGHFVGIVTRRDIIRYMAAQDEDEKKIV